MPLPSIPPAQTRFQRQTLDGPRSRSPRGAVRFLSRPARRAILCLFPFLLALLTGLFPTWPSPQGKISRNSVTRPASLTPLTPAEEKAFSSAPSPHRAAAPSFPDAGRQTFSRPISLSVLPAEADLPLLSSREADNGDSLLVFSRDRFFLSAGGGSLPLERLAEIFPRDSAPAPEAAFSPLPGYRPAEALLLASAVFCDQEGNPNPLAAWIGGGLLLPGGAGPCSPRDNAASAAVRRLVADLDLSAVSGRARKYRAIAEAYARKYTLSPSLVLAIMHTESNFNPQAVSASSALGLMQIVPETAGNEVYRYLKGAHGVPSMDTLFSPESNIHYGTAYLHLLARRYFPEVINSASRDMCVIAAYNGGPGAVLRLFDLDREVAVARINAMTPEEVYTALTTRMPNLETRRYVEVVLGHQRSYAR